VEVFLFLPVAYMMCPLFRSLKEAFVYVSDGEIFVCLFLFVFLWGVAG